MSDYEINEFSPQSGRTIKENGNLVNLGDILEHVEEYGNAVDHGEAYAAKGSISISSADGSKWIIGQTAADVLSMFEREIEIVSANNAADVTVRLWEGIQSFTGGTPVTAQNFERNPEKQTAPTFTIFTEPSSVVKGLAIELIPFGNRFKIDKEQTFFRINGNRYNMRKNTIYGLEITNANLNASTLNVVWRWFKNRIF